MRVFRSAFLVGLIGSALTLVGCGGGRSDTEPPVAAQTAIVEYLSDVVTPTGEEASKYEAVPGTDQLIYTGLQPPDVGKVVVLNDTAYKIASRSERINGRVILSTTTPNFEDVFERLTVTTEVAITSALSSNRVRPLASLPLPSIPILPDLGDLPMELSGSLTNAVVTVEFDYERLTGLKKAKLLAQGNLSASAALRVKVGASSYHQFPAATPLAIPIPATLGTLSIKLPIAVFVRTDSSLEVGIARWQGSWSFAAGTQYNPATQSFENLSYLTETTSSTEASNRSVLETALAALGAISVTQKTAVASLTIGPQISLQFSALNDSVGVLGVRHEIGFKSGVNLLGTFPTLIDCAQIPLSLNQAVYAFLNYKTYDSILDFEGEVVTREKKILTNEVMLNTATFGTCGKMYLATYTVRAVKIGTPIREECFDGICRRELFCTSEEVGFKFSSTDTWRLENSGSAEIDTDAGLSLSGTFNNQSGVIDVGGVIAKTNVTPPGSTTQFFHDGQSQLHALLLSSDGSIQGTLTDTFATSWDFDNRRVECTTTWDYVATPVGGP